MLLDSSKLTSRLQGRWLDCSPPPPQFDSTLVSTDSRKIPRDAFFFALKGEKFDGHDFLQNAVGSGAAAVCVSAKNSHAATKLHIPALIVDDTGTAYARLAQLNREQSNAKIIAITGSSGKTSTKDFLSAIIESAFGHDAVLSTQGNTNNLVGVPLNLLRISEKHSFAIIEMGTNHFGEIEALSLCAKPDMAIVTSIGRGHIEFLGSLDGVAREKSSVFKGLAKGGTAIIPADCDYREILVSEAQKADARILSFSCSENKNCRINARCFENSLDGSNVEFHFADSGRKIKFRLPVPGIHQISNALAATTCAIELGISPDIIQSALANASVGGMRMRRRTTAGIMFINDAYNSNPDSAKAGLQWLSEAVATNAKTVIFLGDMLELGDKAPALHDEVILFASQKFPSAEIIAVGPLMSAAARKNLPDIANFANSNDAANFAKSTLKKGDIVYIKGSRGMAMEKIENIFEAPSASQGK